MGQFAKDVSTPLIDAARISLGWRPCYPAPLWLAGLALVQRQITYPMGTLIWLLRHRAPPPDAPPVRSPIVIITDLIEYTIEDVPEEFMVALAREIGFDG